MLLSDQEILIQGRLQRPNDGKVAANGTFIFNDWMFGEGLKGTFYAFSSTGEVLIKRSVQANLYNNGISNDGRYACFQTCHTDDKNTDSNAFFLFDLATKTLLSKFSPMTGWAKKYCFDTFKQIIFYDYGDGKIYRYNFDGQCLDADKWLRDREQTASGYLALELALEKLVAIKSKNLADYKGVLILLEKAEDGKISPHTQAKVKRTLGEIYLNCDDKTQAIQYFEEALTMNDKVGVKKLLLKLRADQST